MGAFTMETYTPKTFTFDIPIRAKAVQSTRFARGHSFVDAKTKNGKRLSETVSSYTLQMYPASFRLRL